MVVGQTRAFYAPVVLRRSMLVKTIVCNKHSKKAGGGGCDSLCVAYGSQSLIGTKGI